MPSVYGDLRPTLTNDATPSLSDPYTVAGTKVALSLSGVKKCSAILLDYTPPSGAKMTKQLWPTRDISQFNVDATINQVADMVFPVGTVLQLRAYIQRYGVVQYLLTY